MDQGGNVIIKDPDSGKTHEYNFDCSYWSYDQFTENPETKYLTPDPGGIYAD